MLVSAGNKKITDFAGAKWDFAEATPFRDARSETEGILLPTTEYLRSPTSSLLVSAGNKKITDFERAKWVFAEAPPSGMPEVKRRESYFLPLNIYVPQRQACL
ncbi:MAG: hypothetical protein RIC95_10270 [Vicingaceae bacterium]